MRRPTGSPTEVFGGLTATSESFGTAPGGLTKRGRSGETPAALLGRLVAAPGALGALVSHMGVASAHELSQSSPAMVRSRDGSQRFPRPFGGSGGVHVIEVPLRPGPFPGLPTAVPSRVWSLAAGDVQPVGHDCAILALPVPYPLQTVPVGGAPLVYLQGVTGPSPLLELSLSFGSTGASALAASLRAGKGGEEVLTLPVHVRADFAREMDRPVGAEPPCEPVFASSMESGE